MTLSRATPIRRTAFAKLEAVSGLPFATKPRPCKACAKDFVPRVSMQVVCGPRCAHRLVKMDKAAEKVADKARLAALRPLSWHKKQAQAAVNAYVRARDAHLPCISCGRMHKGSWDAGHYRTRGSSPHLALDPRNVHRQCVPCNQHQHGNVVEFRRGLIARFGAEFVEALEADQSTKKYTAAEFDEIAATYRAKTRALNAAAAAQMES